jgi:kinesin family protein 3/17
MSAYEQRNRDLVHERELRKQLEEKISALNS